MCTNFLPKLIQVHYRVNFDLESFKPYWTIASDLLMLEPQVAFTSITIFKHRRCGSPLTDHYWRAIWHPWLLTTIHPPQARHPVFHLRTAHVLPMREPNNSAAASPLMHSLPARTIDDHRHLASPSPFFSLYLLAWRGSSTYKWLLLLWQRLIQEYCTQVKGAI